LTYEAVFLNIFLKQFKKLPKNMQKRVQRRIQELIENPYLGLRLRGPLEGFWKDRVGDYRIIYRVEEGIRRLIFYDVDLRKRIYR